MFPAWFCGCGSTVAKPAPQGPSVVLGAVSAVTPSAAGTPTTVASWGSFEFVSVQGTGQIVTYDLSTGVQVLASVYATPCKDPSGMAAAGIGTANVLAVTCYDTGSLLTLTIQADGSLTALGSVSGLGTVYPGTVLDGTNVLVPVFGVSQVSNGGVVKVSIALPAAPAIVATAALASPVPGGYANPGFLTLANGYIYFAAGSESAPASQSSTIQVMDEATLTLVGAPLVVAHSPQQIAVQDGVAYVTIYDAAQLETIDVSHPAAMSVLGITPLTVGGPMSGSVGGSNGASICNPLPVILIGTNLYLGCYGQATIERLDVTDPAAIVPVQAVSGIVQPQRLMVAGGALIAVSSATGGSVYRIALGAR